MCCSAVGSDLSKFLHAVFDDHHDRPPTGAETNYYAHLSRTEGPLEAYIRMVSSEDYYVTQCRQDADLYVTRLYQLFLHRDPRPDEQRFWVTQYRLTRGADRATFVREFCQANNVQQVPSAPLPYRADMRLPNSAAAVAEALVGKVTLLQSFIQREMGGTRFGREVLNAIAALRSASMQYRDTVNSPQSSDSQLQISAGNVARAWQQVESQFHAVPAASAQALDLLWDLSELVEAAGTTAAGGVPRPASPNPVAANPVAANPVAASAEQLSTLLRQYVPLLSGYQNRGSLYVALYRDVNGLYVQVETLRQLARTAQRQSDLQRVVQSILNQSREVARQLPQADTALQQGWWNIQHELDRLALAVGSGGDLYVAAAHPVVINRPAWNGFPTPLSPGYQASATNRQVIVLADQLVAAVEKYVDSLRPLAHRNREVSRMIDQSLDLRHDVLVLRQQAATGQAGSQLRRTSGDVIREYRDVASQTFLKMVGQDATLNSPAWQQIGELAYQIGRTLSS